jgi:hypothetical protein
MRTAILSVLLVVATLASAEEVWRWVDADGITHYSDRPVPGAEKIDLKVQTYTPPARASTSTSDMSTADEEPAPDYQNLEIWKPAQDEAIVNMAGSVPVRLRLEPPLAPAHSIYIYLDGKRVDGLSQNALEYQSAAVPRGTHTLTAMVSDAKGKTLIQAPQVVFHVVQTSVANPPVGPALRPRPKPTPVPNGAQ